MSDLLLSDHYDALMTILCSNWISFSLHHRSANSVGVCPDSHSTTVPAHKRIVCLKRRDAPLPRIAPASSLLILPAGRSSTKGSMMLYSWISYFVGESEKPLRFLLDQFSKILICLTGNPYIRQINRFVGFRIGRIV